jgi:hypothetical protein
LRNIFSTWANAQLMEEEQAFGKIFYNLEVSFYPPKLRAAIGGRD